MSIYGSIWGVGGDRWDATHDGSVLTYQGSHIYPQVETHKAAHVGGCAIPSWCVPGQEDTDEDDPLAGGWLRLSLATWSDEWGQPMIADGATVVLDRDAARSMAAGLLEWADRQDDEPR